MTSQCVTYLPQISPEFLRIFSFFSFSMTKSHDRRVSLESQLGRPKKAGKAKAPYFTWTKHPNLVTQLKAYLKQDCTAEEIAAKPAFAEIGLTAKQISNKINALKVSGQPSSRVRKIVAGKITDGSLASYRFL